MIPSMLVIKEMKNHSVCQILEERRKENSKQEWRGGKAQGPKLMHKSQDSAQKSLSSKVIVQITSPKTLR